MVKLMLTHIMLETGHIRTNLFYINWVKLNNYSNLLIVSDIKSYM